MFFSREASKSHMAGFLAFLFPILTYLQAEAEWSWRAFGGAVISGVITALSVYAVPNAAATGEPRRLQLRSRRRGQEPSWPDEEGQA